MLLLFDALLLQRIRHPDMQQDSLNLESLEFSTDFGPCLDQTTDRAEIITELILERASPGILGTFLLEFITFRLIPVIFLQKEAKPENYWKR